MQTRLLTVLAAAAVLVSAQAPAHAADSLKVAISQRGFWDSSFLEFAQKEGFLREANLDVEFFYTEGGGSTLQTLTSGSVDVAMSNGLLGALGAYAKGAQPVPVPSPLAGDGSENLAANSVGGGERILLRRDPSPNGVC
jgi:NitT/TauT family transport system substrate-binding protein